MTVPCLEDVPWCLKRDYFILSLHKVVMCSGILKGLAYPGHLLQEHQQGNPGTWGHQFLPLGLQMASADDGLCWLLS